MATVDEIALRIRQRTDNEHSTSDFVDPDELIGLIDLYFKELSALLVRHKMHQDEPVQSITANGALSYAVNAHYSIIAVFRVDDTNRVPLGKHSNRFKLNPEVKGPAVTYRIYSGAIEFDPVPQDGTYEIRYIARPTQLTTGGQTVDGVVGWEEYIVCAASRDLFVKEGNLAAAAEQDNARERVAQRIKVEAAEEEQTQSYRIQDVRARVDNVWLEGTYLDRSGVRGAWYRPWWRR